jgi:hypothetical protein
VKSDVKIVIESYILALMHLLCVTYIHTRMVQCTSVTRVPITAPLVHE